MKKLKLLVCFSALFWALGCSEDPMALQDNLPLPSGMETRSDGYPGDFDLAYALIDHERSTLDPLQMWNFCANMQGLMAQYPLFRTLVQYLYEQSEMARYKIVLNIDPYINGRACFSIGYNYNSISFQSQWEIHGDNILEEIIHAVQFWVYGYTMMTQSKRNIEFEAKLFIDIMYYHDSNNTNRLIWNINNSNFDINAFQFVELYYCDFFNLVCGDVHQRVHALDRFNATVNAWGGERNASYNPYFFPDMFGLFWINHY